MGDLISRSAVIEVLNKYKFGAISNDTEREYTKETVLNFINEQPTAYSVEKVVAELEERLLYSQDIGLSELMEKGHTFKTECFKAKTNAYSDAISIVKAGGVE